MGRKIVEILLPYKVSLKEAKDYLEKSGAKANMPLGLPPDLQNDADFIDFQEELKKLPIATRLHLFDIFEYSKFCRKEKPIKERTFLRTRSSGIDEEESARILLRSNFICSDTEGVAGICHKYNKVLEMVTKYVEAISPAYDEWTRYVLSTINNEINSEPFSFYIDEKGNKIFP